MALLVRDQLLMQRVEEALRVLDARLELQLLEDVARERLHVQRHLLRRREHARALRPLERRRLPPQLLRRAVHTALRGREVDLEALETARPALELGERARDLVRVVAHRLSARHGAREPELHGVAQLGLRLLELLELAREVAQLGARRLGLGGVVGDRALQRGERGLLLVEHGLLLAERLVECRRVRLMPSLPLRSLSQPLPQLRVHRVVLGLRRRERRLLGAQLDLARERRVRLAPLRDLRRARRQLSLVRAERELVC